MNCFNDDIQGTGAVIAAGYLSANRLAKVPIEQQKIVFYGAGSAAVGVADQIAVLLATMNNLSVEEVRNKFYLVDSKGLVTSTRGDTLQSHKVKYARKEGVEYRTLIEIVKGIRPTALIGLAGTPGAFDPEVITEMGKMNDRPIIFALSNPTDKAECTAEQAYLGTDGRAVFASGSPFKPVSIPSGQTIFPGQGNNMYIFPGLGFGAWLARSKVSPQMVTQAAATLAAQVTQADLDLGRVYPKISNIREISANIAVAVMEQSFKEGLARIDRPKGDLLSLVRSKMYSPVYTCYE
jgi:malic enzyme